VNPLAFVLGRVLLPLLCGALGGIVAISLTAPPAESQACRRLSEQVNALQAQVKDLRFSAPQVAAVEASPLTPQLEDERKKLTEDLRARAQAMKDQIDATRAKIDQRRDDKVKESAEVELVKLRNLQQTITPEKTKENVARHLARLGLSEADVATVSGVGAQYIRERSEALIKILERASTGTKVNKAEIEEQLRPLDERLSSSLPKTLDDVTRRAIVTDLRSMVVVPYFFRE
jgi:hypothetical protein